MENEEPNYNVPMWKFFVALAVVLIAVTFGTLLWMKSDTKPRRRPALLGAPEPTAVQTNTNSPVPAQR